MKLNNFELNSSDCRKHSPAVTLNWIENFNRPEHRSFTSEISEYDVSHMKPTFIHHNTHQINELQVKVLGMLHHPYIIAYYDSFEEDGLLMIEMEYADGG